MVDRKRLSLVAVMTCCIFVGAFALSTIQVPIPEVIPFLVPVVINGLEGTWYIAGPFSYSDGNSTKTVVLASVAFTFLSYDPDYIIINGTTTLWLLDAGIRVHIRVDFPDHSTEAVDVFVGGFCPPGPRFYTCEGGPPTVVIITHMSTSDTDWYSWYYAVSAA